LFDELFPLAGASGEDEKDEKRQAQEQTDFFSFSPPFLIF